MVFKSRFLFLPIVLDASAEKWCQDNFLSHSSLKTAEAIRSELTDTLNRIELPISEPSFGTKTNSHNLKRALLAGFFMQVSGREMSALMKSASSCSWNGIIVCSVSPRWQIARDVDGSGNYLILTHKHVAHVHPHSAYGAQSHKLGLPEWVVFHDYTFSENNCMRTVSEISPQV